MQLHSNLVVYRYKCSLQRKLHALLTRRARSVHVSLKESSLLSYSTSLLLSSEKLLLAKKWLKCGILKEFTDFFLFRYQFHEHKRQQLLKAARIRRKALIREEKGARPGSRHSHSSTNRPISPRSSAPQERAVTAAGSSRMSAQGDLEQANN